MNNAIQFKSSEFRSLILLPVGEEILVRYLVGISIELDESTGNMVPVGYFDSNNKITAYLLTPNLARLLAQHMTGVIEEVIGSGYSHSKYWIKRVGLDQWTAELP